MCMESHHIVNFPRREIVPVLPFINLYFVNLVAFIVVAIKYTCGNKNNILYCVVVNVSFYKLNKVLVFLHIIMQSYYATFDFLIATEEFLQNTEKIENRPRKILCKKQHSNVI